MSEKRIALTPPKPLAGYPPNTYQWRKGDIVLHWHDEKHPRMFMVVIGYTRDGMVKTQYVDRRRKRTIYKNDLKNLLGLDQFNLKGDEDPDEYERVRLWNFYQPIGTPVFRIDATGMAIGPDTKTRSKAWLAGGHSGIVLLEGVVGAWELRWLRVRK